MRPNQTGRTAATRWARGQAGAMKCVCGQDVQLIDDNLYRCSACGRAKWGDESVSGTWIAVILVVTVLALIALAIVGISGAKYRA
jgi:hypothetical protein